MRKRERERFKNSRSRFSANEDYRITGWIIAKLAGLCTWYYDPSGAFRATGHVTSRATFIRSTFIAVEAITNILYTDYRICISKGCLLNVSPDTPSIVEALSWRQQTRQDTIITRYNGPIMVRYEASYCFRDKAPCPMDVYDCLVSRFTELTRRTVSKREC